MAQVHTFSPFERQVSDIASVLLLIALYHLRDVSDPVTVCSTSDGWNNVHKTCVDALDFLGKHRFIEWSQGLERYSPTPFGLATFCSSLPPKDAITVAR